MPLVIAPLNKELKIIKVLASEKLKKHLESLGIMENQMIEVISQANKSVIVKIKEGRIALDSDVASKIIVA